MFVAQVGGSNSKIVFGLNFKGYPVSRLDSAALLADASKSSKSLQGLVGTLPGTATGVSVFISQAVLVGVPDETTLRAALGDWKDHTVVITKQFGFGSYTGSFNGLACLAVGEWWSALCCHCVVSPPLCLQAKSDK